MKHLISLVLAMSLCACATANDSIKQLFKSVNPSVVELHVKALSSPQPGEVKFHAATASSLGSGALVTSSGRILTASHVVDRATSIEVIYSDGTKSRGHVVWVDPIVDLAMIHAENVPEGISPLPLAKSDSYSIGEQVVVIGAPLGVSHSLSVGYLSGIRDGQEIPGTNIKPRLLQTDAAINKGNSGGPMFNLKGEIIGIVSYILSQSGGSEGLGFVVSVDTVHDVINSDPMTFLGFIPTLLNPELSQAINNHAGYGILIQQVIPNTLADVLGFKGGTISVLIGRTPFY